MRPARGSYRYRRDGQPQDVVEPWEVSPQGPERVLRGQRIVGGTPRLDVLARYRHGTCESFEVTWEPGGAARSARLRRSEVGRSLLLFPLLRAATGLLLTELARGPRCLVLPDLRDPSDAGFLRPLHSLRRAEPGTDGPRHYRYYGGEYGEAGADYWLNEDGYVARYRWAAPDGLWQAELEDYLCSPASAV